MKNILVNEDSIVSGVIDWGDMNIGHPACDLSIAYSFLPPQERQVFYEEYGIVDEETKSLAQLISVFILMLILMQSIDAKDSSMELEARIALNRALTV